MKKLLGIVVLSLLLSGNAYAAKWCGLISDGLTIKGDYLEVKLYNSGNETVQITGINYHKNGAIDREYSINHQVTPKRNIEFRHYTTESYLDDVPSVSFKCKYPYKVQNNSTQKKKTKNCSDTNYDSPCTCKNEPNAIKKKYCEIRKKNANKLSRIDAAGYCAEEASQYSKEVGKEYYKDCMKDEGY